jgi:two-component system, NarL family, nitrate/nitrite response regulator NarL
MPDTIRVMLVDDHRTMLWGLERLIDGEAPRMHVAATARSADEALARIGIALPDVVLLDLDLDGHDGLEIMPRLLQHPVQVLVLTGTRDQSILYQAVRAGARGVVRKDEPAERLLKAIEKVHAGEFWVDQPILGRLVHELVRPEQPEAARHASLTARELKIIRIMVERNGDGNRAIANVLFISEHTLRKHLTSIYRKLDIGTRLELYAYAIRHGLAAAAPPLKRIGPGVDNGKLAHQA